MSDLNDEPARLCVEFDFFGQVGLDEERLGNPNPPRISDASRSASWLPFVMTAQLRGTALTTPAR
jgi:hypothetical protein